MHGIHYYYSGRISHMPETRQAFRKFLSMFTLKNILSPNVRETRRDLKQRTATRAGRTQSIPNALVASFGRVSDVRLVYVEFCYFFFSTRPVRVLLIRYCVTAVLNGNFSTQRLKC